MFLQELNRLAEGDIIETNGFEHGLKEHAASGSFRNKKTIAAFIFDVAAQQILP